MNRISSIRLNHTICFSPSLHARSFLSKRTSVAPAFASSFKVQARLHTHDGSFAHTSRLKKRVPSLLALLLAVGVGVTAYGIYDLYQMLTLWPTEVRTALRGGLKARERGDLELSTHFLQRAWETSKTLSVEVFKPEPYLKLSGIAILLASVLESNKKPEDAYNVYLDALTCIQQASAEDGLTGPEQLRAIAISYKLGEMAEALGRKEEAEKHLVWAVEGILRSVFKLEENSKRNVQAPPEDSSTFADTHAFPLDTSEPNDVNARIMLSELSLPEWATKTDVAAPLEALGAFYAQAGRVDFAMPLYLQAIGILVPPSSQPSSTEDVCRGAQLMSNLSEIILRSQPLTDKVLHQAEAWAIKGLSIIMETRKKLAQSSQVVNPTCELAYAITLFNVAALRRMAGDKDEAKRVFTLSLKQSKAVGLQSGIEHAEDALRQLEETSGTRSTS